jgi:hypothetical protein
MWKLNNIVLSNQWAKEEIEREIRHYLETNENPWAAQKALRESLQ